MSSPVRLRRVGVRVECSVCGCMKKPVGRDGGVAHYCTRDECWGYELEPFPGSLWPGENEDDFGYPCGTNGTRLEEVHE